MKILHTADLHFSTIADKLGEVVRTTDFLLRQAIAERPDVIILAGDTVDQYDGKIPADSACFRAAKAFMRNAADIAPVIIIRGTKSHDRNTPELFDDIRSQFPIHVACDIQQVALVRADITQEPRFCNLVDAMHAGHDVVAGFTLVPSLDKSFLMADDTAGIRDGNQLFKSVVHDLFAGFGVVNDNVTAAGIPVVLVTHGMLTGACFSSGQTAIGEDLEFSLGDLHAARASYVALGHVHKHQVFPGNVVYCGSPGRLNFGEAEEKGFVIAEFRGDLMVDFRFVQTPARRFCFGEVAEFMGADDVYAQALALAADCRGADVRFRLQVPEENRSEVDRDRLEQIFLAAGAAKVKLELSVIPRLRARSEGISRLEGIPPKYIRWGETVGEVIPDDSLALSAVVEGQSAEEMLVQALMNCEASSVYVPVIAPPASSVSSHLAGVQGACDRYLESAPSGQQSLFGGK